jgi:hypothetical protein
MPTPDPRFQQQLAKPPLLPDPVFPRQNYLASLLRLLLAKELRNIGQAALVQSIDERFSDSCSACVGVANIVAWGFDFEGVAPQGRCGRDEFLERVQHLTEGRPDQPATQIMEACIGRGVVQIQVETDQLPSKPPEYQICRLVTVGFYFALLIPPAAASGDRQVAVPVASVQGGTSDSELQEMLDHPSDWRDRIFPEADCVISVGRWMFHEALFRLLLPKDPELLPQIRPANSSKEMAMFFGGSSYGFWAIDLDCVFSNGVTGRSEFISRVKERIRRPPPAMAAFTAEQHIFDRGVIRVSTSKAEPGKIQGEKTIGYYAAELKSPGART